ncbi:hypothetical protein Rsub_11297 [Raphidocelis subcapitata]|uniref:Cupin type-2 domain-containing protein n=1 Tax=Raphidocelis subcapitata TaxID=307507 RepID=A0A2V0PHS1_9CHLO|nr:hypothetical protein Rsub_11297 [Raphidocelis subcapitata]|eukprot:GBF98572.1 hypothetical protein Rsub_11297 [Raphidocelis subcapitata]
MQTLSGRSRAAAGGRGAPAAPRPGARRATLCRPAPAAAAAEARTHEGGVFVRMEGQPLLELAGGHRAVPLLEPTVQRVPFAMALRIIDPGAAPAQVLGAGAGSGSDDAVELHYVLGGAGSLLGAAGDSQPVGPGDSVLAAPGGATFAVDAGAGAAALVLLQLLLPGKLLRDVAAGQRSAFTDPGELGLSPEWAAPSVVKAGRLTQEMMCSLLSPEAMHSAHAEARAAAAAAAAATASLDDGDAPNNGAEVLVSPLAGGRLVRKRSLSGVRAWQLPNATNQLALLFGPHTDPGMSLTFGVEMFEPGHRTARHIHTAAFEMFIVLGGEGVGISNSDKVPLRAGDVAVFPPHVVHAIDNPSARRLYCLQMMLPNDMFAEFVTSGSLLDPLDRDDMAGIITGTC